MQYYSQDGQDEFIDKYIFSKKRKGFFVDIGANDGIKYSNTYFFEKYRDWSGICFEPLPDIFYKLEKNRKSINIKACVSDNENNSDFLAVSGYSEMLSGLIEKYNPIHLKRLQRELSEYGGKSNIIQVQCIRFDSVIKKYGVSKIDYLSIDVEGNELNILKSIDFDLVSIEVISVENNYHDDELIKYVFNKGYNLKKIIGADYIFVRKKLLQSLFFYFKRKWKK